MSTICRYLGFALTIYIAVGVFLYSMQDSLIYYPTPERVLKNMDYFILESEGESIKIVRVNPGKNKAILYFGGNNEFVGSNGPTFLKLFPQHTVYLINYRGYSGSTGVPNEKALYADALNAYDHVKVQHGQISAIGRSLGTGVVTHLATKRSLNRIALVTPYDSLKDVVQSKFAIYPAALLLKDHYDSIARAPEISIDTLLVIAENDSLIPPKHAMRLSEAFPEGVTTTITIKGAGHNTIGISKGYYKNMSAFFRY